MASQTPTTTFIPLSQVDNDLCMRINSWGPKSNVIFPQIISSRKRAPDPTEFLIHWRCGDIEVVLAVTNGGMGPYPVFLITNLPYSQLTANNLAQPLSDLVEMLLPHGVTRAYSVFAQKPMAVGFANLWTEVTGVPSYEMPYYDAKLSYCQVLRPHQPGSDLALGYELRLANESDLAGIAELCFEFASTSEPFTLTREGAFREAKYLVNKQIVWVHTGRLTPDAEPSIACIVATTRNAPSVATITKVVSSTAWRRRGCAERLVRHVTKELLSRYGHKYVALYVANDNRAAINVYHKVGFVGLAGDASNYADVDDWVELGFDRRKVTLGHW